MNMAILFVYMFIFVGIIFMIKNMLVRMKSKKYDNRELKQIIFLLSIINFFILGLICNVFTSYFITI